MYKNKYIYILQEGSGGSRQTPKKFHKNQIKWRLFLKMGYAKEFFKKIKQNGCLSFKVGFNFLLFDRAP